MGTGDIVAIRWTYALALAVAIYQGSEAALAYDGSRDDFLRFLGQYGLADWAPAKWASTAEIGYFKAPDGVELRYAHWPQAAASPQGTVVHFNGRTEFIERNVLIYRELAASGWDLWTLDWRGQGLSDRPLDGDRSVRGHIDKFETYLNDAATFVREKVKFDRQPRVLLAHSMGGQIALRYVLENPGTFDLVVLTSPLVRLPSWAAATLADLKEIIPKELKDVGACAVGKAAEWRGSFIVEACRVLPEPTASQLNDAKDSWGYTHDERNLAVSECLIERSRAPGGGPGLAVSCPTAGWLVAAHQSIKEVFERKDELKEIPMLIVAAKDDPAVGPGGQKELCDALPKCTLVQVQGTGHELMIETPMIRDALLKCFDEFTADTVAGGIKCAEIISDLGRL